jgi:hypothetical protein
VVDTLGIQHGGLRNGTTDFNEPGVLFSADRIGARFEAFKISEGGERNAMF